MLSKIAALYRYFSGVFLLGEALERCLQPKWRSGIKLTYHGRIGVSLANNRLSEVGGVLRGFSHS
jgi:hypothetical protein